MRRIAWTWAAITVLNLSVAQMAVHADEHQAAPQPGASASKAKVGDQVTCAIDGMKMPLQAETPSAEYQGKTYYFCSEAEKQQFLKNPERYAQH